MKVEGGPCSIEKLNERTKMTQLKDSGKKSRRQQFDCRLQRLYNLGKVYVVHHARLIKFDSGHDEGGKMHGPRLSFIHMLIVVLVSLLLSITSTQRVRSSL